MGGSQSLLKKMRGAGGKIFIEIHHNNLFQRPEKSVI